MQRYTVLQQSQVASFKVYIFSFLLEKLSSWKLGRAIKAVPDQATLLFYFIHFSQSTGMKERKK